MKILVLIHEFPPVGGGGGRVARDLAIGLAARGHELRVLTTHMEGLPFFEEIDGVQVERIRSKRKTAFRAELAEMAQFNLAALNAARRIVRDWRPDLIHAHFAVPAGAAAFVLSKLTGIPYVLTAHLGDVPGAVPEKTDRWFKWIFPLTPPIWRGAARVVAVSEFTRRMALQHYDVPIEVIPNGVELSSLPAPARGDDQPRIVFAGRFMEQKNPAHLVQALTQLKDLSWQCAMLGDGPLLGSIRADLARTGLEERFWLPGWITPEHVLAEFARSDILVLPSRSEGLSVVAVQALGMGLALVLSDAGGNLELVRDGENGFIFPVGAVDLLAEQLSMLLKNPSMLQSAQAKSLEMAKKFNLPEIISQYENIFSSLKTKSAS
ncbi:MAG TPA: glycosyltransferase family 4 protein [Anaerolineales bacterium]|jgi:glycosyltransferase involved in cell wall biosynthesis